MSPDPVGAAVDPDWGGVGKSMRTAAFAGDFGGRVAGVEGGGAADCDEVGDGFVGAEGDDVADVPAEVTFIDTCMKQNGARTHDPSQYFKLWT